MSKHYAIADIHGMYNIYEQVCEILQPNDVVYFLGDAGDRGYAGFKCIKAIYNNPQWIYLKGNHEDMMVKALQQNRSEINGYLYNNPLNIWFCNGGEETFNDWLEEGRDESWITKLQNLPLTAEYTNSKGFTFHMSHAGYTCGRKDQMWREDLVWSREHFSSKWDEEYYPKDICIHGHTPIFALVKYLEEIEPIIELYNHNNPEARSYCGGHKIDIDNGVFFTKATVLYDLDEMKAIQIFDRNKEWEWS